MAPPSERDQALAFRYRPRLLLPADHPGPIDFYADYIAQGTLRDRDGNVISDRVTQAMLNKYRDDRHVVFVHEPRHQAPEPKVYARITREVIDPTWYPGVSDQPYTFIGYTAVFRHSGLPASLSWWQESLVSLFAQPEDWHQLDHYTSVTLVLDPADQPVAAIFQHHNYMRTYMLDLDITLPDDQRLRVDVAVRSNELYPARNQPAERRAVRFLDTETFAYLITGESQPWLAGDDLTQPADEIDYELVFLPPSDAFYHFKGFLGERRLLPGRDGPPGADFNTLPVLKPLTMQMFVSYWRDGDLATLSRFSSMVDDWRDHDGWRAFAMAQAAQFARDRACANVIQMACLTDTGDPRP